MSNKGQSKSLWEAEEGHAGASDEELHRAHLLGQSLLQAGTARLLGNSPPTLFSCMQQQLPAMHYFNETQ